jgi:thiol:disulfide interchange protein DsbD
MRRIVVALLAAAVLACPAAAQDRTVFTASASWRDGLPAPGASGALVVTVAVDAGWHVNSNTPLEDYLIPTVVRLELPAGWSADAPVYPAHREARFAFSEQPVAVYDGRFEITTTVRRGVAAADAPVRGVLEAQACNDRVCLAPAEVAFSVGGAGAVRAGAAPAASPLATYDEPPAGLSQRFLGGSLPLQLLLVFLAGLALNLTPCVYPLIPITVGFFMAQRAASRGRTFALAVAYVLGMSVTYSALGVAAALTGRLFGAALQSPLVVGAIVAVLLALAASMFGAWEIRVPAWATRVSGGRSGLGGAVVMGLVVGLVAAPCIGPFVLGLLTYVGQRQDVALGFTLFFVLALGLGLPYLVLAVSTRALERLPNSGAWMLGVRQLFGVLLVALAAWFVRPFLAEPLGDWLFATLLGLGGLYLLVVARPGHGQPWVDRFMRLASAALIVAAVLLAPRARPHGGAVLAWQPYDAAAVAQALDGGTPVVLDFFADWCAPCKELDEKTFSDPRVAAALAGFARFKVDLTRSEPRSEALRERYGVAGVPTIAFFAAGREVTGARLTGFEPPPAFLRRLARVSGR